MKRRRPLEERFWAKVLRTPSCWLWTAYLDADGYGTIGRGGRGEGMVRAHRVAYELLVGPIPQGLELDHLCGNRACVRPAHLEAVTHAENVRREAARRTTCPAGHPFDEANTYRNRKGHRSCRVCAAAYQRERRARLRSAA